ncbi:MAG TPA: YbaN family protein [Caulobacter sp.]|nr:YbaN family protein [Caulobacter sp.]
MIPPQPPDKPAAGAIRRLLLRALGVAMVLLAAAGVFLPLLPTTPFLLVALWAFTASAPEWAERLRRHRRFGPLLVAWEERRAIPTSGKIAAGTAMAASWAVLALTYDNLWVVGAVGAVLGAVFAYVVTRPSR